MTAQLIASATILALLVLFIGIVLVVGWMLGALVILVKGNIHEQRSNKY